MTKRNTPYIHTLHLVLTPRNREEPSILLGLLIFMQWPTSAAWFLAFSLSTEIALRGLGIITFAQWLHSQQQSVD